MAYDQQGMWCIQNGLSDEVHDLEYFQDILMSDNPSPNEIHEEMWSYWKKVYPRSHEEYAPFPDLLEVYCSAESQLTQQAQHQGLSAKRFGLYDELWHQRPTHLWLSPRCGPWSGWNHLNASKSRHLASRIAASRRSEKVHLNACDALFRLQVWRGTQYHFHLEQPVNSPDQPPHSQDALRHVRGR